MLHILWIFFKFILILLGILLLLILAAALLILFCPVRYQASALKETESFKEARLIGRISWLFGAVSAEIFFQNSVFEKEIRILGIPLLKVLKNHRNKKKTKVRRKQRDAHSKTQIEKTDAAVEDSRKESTMEKSTEQTEPYVPEIEIKTESFSENKEETDSSQIDSATIKEKKGLRSRVSGFQKKISEFAGKLFSKIRKLKSSGRRIYEKIRKLKSFLDHPEVQQAFIQLKDKVFRLIRHVFPTGIKGTVRFSCSDPSVTGKILALTGMTIPLHKNCIRVVPLFEDQNMIEGNISIKGRVYGIVILVTGLQLYFDKNIKFIIKKWKKHKEV